LKDVFGTLAFSQEAIVLGTSGLKPIGSYRHRHFGLKPTITIDNTVAALAKTPS
jgi:hypothetical protein